MVQVELRESTSICLFLRALNRSAVDTGTYCTFEGSLKIAAASALQKSTSKPDHWPFASLTAKPSSPWLTPHASEPRSCTVLSVWASAPPAPDKAARPSAAAAARNGFTERMGSLA